MTRHWKKYFAASDYNKLTSKIIGAKIKEKELVNKSNISGFIDKKIETLATKAELKAELDKIVNLHTYDLSCFLGKNFFVMMVLRICLNMFSTSELKEDKGSDNAIGWK